MKDLLTLETAASIRLDTRLSSSRHRPIIPTCVAAAQEMRFCSANPATDEPAPFLPQAASERQLMALGQRAEKLGVFVPRPSDKRGAIPVELRPILQRLAVNADTWLDTIQSFGGWFHRAVGRVSNMAARASRSGKHWFQGTAFSRLAFD
jgi:hypothetical protein